MTTAGKHRLALAAFILIGLATDLIIKLLSWAN